MKNHSILLLFSLIILSFCSKEDDKAPPAPWPKPVYANYSCLKTGNYWIYQRFTSDPSGFETDTREFDSCYVEKDTIINNKMYFKVVRPYDKYYSQIDFLRDSLHYIVNNKGEMQFSSQDFSTVLYNYFYTLGNPPSDTLLQSIRVMVERDYLISTSAGVYKTLNSRRTVVFFPKYTNGGYYRYLNCRYAENVGIVDENLEIYLAGKAGTLRRLVRYHLN